MKAILAAVAALGLACSVQAQQRSFSAQGVLQPMLSQAGQGVLLEVLGKGSDGDYTEYFSLDLLPGTQQALIADHSAALAAQVLNQYTQANARFSYDLSAVPTSGGAGFGQYPVTSFSLTLNGTSGLTGTVHAELPRVFVRDRTTRRTFTLSGQGNGYPPATLPSGESLAFTDEAPIEFKVDLRDLMASTSCCSSLHLSAPGPLAVVLRSPTEYRPVYMGLSLAGSRSASDPVDGSLPSALDLARYEQDQSMYVAFGGHYSLSVDEAAYASQADFLAAQSWVANNINLVNIEVPLGYEITALQAVPEPTTAGLLAAGLLMLALRRRLAV